MAILSTDGLSLEMTYTGFDCEEVAFEIRPLWQGEPIINDAVLAKFDASRTRPGCGVISASEFGGCGILPVLRKTLETNVSGYWEATQPNILFAIHTDDYFPFLPSDWVLIRENPELKAQREDRARRRAVSGMLPDDILEVSFSFDLRNFKYTHMYHGSGLCFRLLVTRAELHDFYAELRSEYVDLRKRYRIDDDKQYVWSSDF